MDFTFEINAQVHTLLVNFFFQPPQPQSMMQRQLGTSQLPNSSSHRGSMMAPPTNGNGKIQIVDFGSQCNPYNGGVPS